MKKLRSKLTLIMACGLLCLSANFPTTEADHDIHLSKCQIDCTGENLTLKCHFWLDDLTAALALNSIDDPNFLTPNESSDADEILTAYLQKKVRLIVNGERVNPAWVGKTASEDGLALWVEMKAELAGPPKHLRIQNELLMELYDDQQNIVHLKGPGDKQGYLIFDKTGQEESINF